MTDSLVTKLVAIFQNCNLGSAETAVGEAMKKTYPEIPMIRLFDAQMEVLRRRSKHLVDISNIIDEFIRRKKEIVDIIMKRKVPKDWFPFVPVIPRSMVKVDKLMSMIVYNHMRGYNFLDQEKLTDYDVDLPTDPYFILNIRKKEAQNFSKETKVVYNLTVDEGISFWIHQVGTLPLRHCMSCAGSCYDNTGTPFIHFSKVDTRPNLHQDNIRDNINKRGFASCCERV